jgi:hypothetical protein
MENVFGLCHCPDRSCANFDSDTNCDINVDSHSSSFNATANASSTFVLTYAEPVKYFECRKRSRTFGVRMYDDASSYN